MVKEVRCTALLVLCTASVHGAEGRDVDEEKDKMCHTVTSKHKLIRHHALRPCSRLEPFGPASAKPWHDWIRRDHLCVCARKHVFCVACCTCDKLYCEKLYSDKLSNDSF